MDKFYSILSQYYDRLFKSSPGKIDFLQDGLSESGGNVLDVGAATGTFSLPLASKGHRVIAVDYDRQMVARMAEKALERHLENHISKVGDMRTIGLLADEGPFDLIYCIGNTLVHLDNHKEVALFLKAMYQMLKPGGRVVLQTVNYDRVLLELKNKGTYEFPVIQVDEESLWFKRSYKLLEGDQKVVFETVFDDGEAMEKPMGETILLALQAHDLDQMLNQCGFDRVALYGDFDKRAFVSGESSALVVEAFKKQS